MKAVIGLVLCNALWVMSASARLGETPEQCRERYGQAVTNLAGHEQVSDVQVFNKDGIFITVLFVNAIHGNEAGFVIYSRVAPITQGVLMTEPKMTPEEETALLNTVPGRWQDYSPAPTLAGTPTNIIALSAVSITDQYREKTKESIEAVARVLFPPRKTMRTRFFTAQDISHNGSKLFAFRIANGVAICSFDAVAAASAWASHVITQAEKEKQESKPKLSGF